MIKIPKHKATSNNLSELLDYITSNCDEKPKSEKTKIDKNQNGEMIKYAYEVEYKDGVIYEFIIQRENNTFKLSHFIINKIEDIEKDDLD